MKTKMLLVLLSSLLFGVSSTFSIANDLTSLNYEEETKQGIVVVEYWASWNTQNMVTTLTDLWIKRGKDVKISRVNICENADLVTKYNIIVVPTIIFYNEGKEVKRIEGDLTFTLKITIEEINDIIKEIKND